MLKIKKNLTAIEQKFQSLKATHKLYEEPTTIGEIAQVMTYGVVSAGEVQEYVRDRNLSQQMSSQQKEKGQKQKVNQNWFDLNIQQMILFLDKVIKHRNINKPKQTVKRQRLIMMPLKKKKKNREANIQHQNPYIPHRIQLKGNAQELQNAQSLQQKLSQIIDIDSPYVSSQQQDSPEYVQGTEFSVSEGNEMTESVIQKKKIDKESFLNLQEGFKSLPVEQRYGILADKYQKMKDALQKKFNTIYKHYRKQMYVPHQSFQKNNQLLMDLRIFLKYYREFEVIKKYKSHEATQLFKKLALNGLWLDSQQFIEIHYKLIQIIDVNDQILNQKLQNKQTFDQRQANELKKQLSKTAKLLMQNLGKLNDLSKVICEQKIKKLLNDSSGSNFIKKIVEVHSGLIKQDVILKLSERVEKRKNKNGFSCNNQIRDSPQKLRDSPEKQKMRLMESLGKRSPHKVSIYRQLQIPELRSREMKKSSIYSSLQILNMHKQKEKLKILINQEEDQKYLQAFFRKQKLLNSLTRNYSVKLLRTDSEVSQNSAQFSLKLNSSIRSINRDKNLLMKSVSLPRMKFT